MSDSTDSRWRGRGRLPWSEGTRLGVCVTCRKTHKLRLTLEVVAHGPWDNRCPGSGRYPVKVLG